MLTLKPAMNHTVNHVPLPERKRVRSIKRAYALEPALNRQTPLDLVRKKKVPSYYIYDNNFGERAKKKSSNMTLVLQRGEPAYSSKRLSMESFRSLDRQRSYEPPVLYTLVNPSQAARVLKTSSKLRIRRK